MKLDILRDNEQWRDLGTMCEQVLTQIADSERGGDELTFSQLSERSWKVWGYIIEAAKNCDQQEQAETEYVYPHCGLWPLYCTDTCSRIKSLLDGKFKQNDSPLFEGRPGMLTQMALTEAIKRPLLPLCKSFWLEQRHIRGCFHDLRKFVAQLDGSDQEQFYEYIVSTTTDMTSDPEFSEQNEVNATCAFFVSVHSLTHSRNYSSAGSKQKSTS
jgi:N-terminal acetyltransferase B complex non-catalytic subunit